MSRFRFIPIAILLFFTFSIAARAQQWSGVLAPARAINWSTAGAGSIPARTTICTTLGVAGQPSSYAQSVSMSQIQTALSSCPSGQTVLLNPGTYATSTSLITTASNVTLRGSGAQKTILNFTGTSTNCNGIGATAVCITSGDSNSLQYSVNVLNWTAGYSQGTTTITAGAAVSGSLSNLKVGALVSLTQADQTSDNGNWWSCGTTGSAGACSQQGVANAWSGRSQTQIVTVTAISGSTITISPGLYAPNWSAGQTPYIAFSSTLPITGFGLENLQVNTQSLGDMQAMTEFNWATNSWIKNVALINNVAINAASRKHVEVATSSHITVRDSYMYGSSPSSEGYGVDMMWGTSDSLAENNICQHLATCNILETGIGNVFGYTYAVDNFYTGAGNAPNWQQCDAFHHDAGDYYNLFEGQEGICASSDDIHGTSFANTIFRSYFNGRDTATQCPGGGNACGTGAKTQNTEAIQKLAFARYDNIVASVLGTSGYFTTYQQQGTSGNPSACPSFNWTSLYNLNFSDQDLTPFSPACASSSFSIDNDPLVSSSLMRWGNYDTVNGSVQTNSAETASTASTYPGLASPSTSWSTFPSLYLSSKPGFWGSMPWPAVGPDVTGGNVANLAGHVYHNPAATCYLTTLGGKADGSSGPISFDASACYPTVASTGGPSPPVNLTGTLQ